MPAGTSWFGNGEDNANLYHPFFTYNFLNEGNHKKGTTNGSGFNIAKVNGCPSLVDFYNPILNNLSDTLSSIYWMNDMEKYINASENTVLYEYISPFKITWNTTLSSLDNLKHWLANHNSNDTTGGLAIISVRTKEGYNTVNIPNESPESGKKMVVSWGTTDGYLKVNCRAYSCLATEPKEKEIFLGFTMSHPKRENMNIKIGVNNDINGYTPSQSSAYGIFNNQGGAYPMNGNPSNPQPIDIALNVSEKYNINDFKRFFLCVYDNNYNDYNNAYIENFQLIDYRWNEKFILNKPGRTYINSNTTTLSIDYDLLPFTIEKHYTCSNDKVVRRDVNVVEGVLTINNGTSIDMYGTTDYNCRLIIDEKSLLNIQDSVVINAIQGDCEVVLTSSLYF